MVDIFYIQKDLNTDTWEQVYTKAMPFYFTSLTTPSPKISSSPYGMWVLPHSALSSRLTLF